MHILVDNVDIVYVMICSGLKMARRIESDTTDDKQIIQVYKFEYYDDF